jgi:hypothetical protein
MGKFRSGDALVGAWDEAEKAFVPTVQLAGEGVGGSGLPSGTDRSGTIAAGGVAQQLAPANAARKSLTVQNVSDGDLWINEIGNAAAIDSAGGWKVGAGQVFAVSTNRAVSIIGATTGQKFTATET